MTHLDPRHAGRRAHPGPSGPLRLADPVLLAGVALVAVATAVRGWLAGRTWFYLDDLVLANQAAADPVSAHSLAEPYYGHLMPGGRLLALLVTKAGPFDYGMARAELVVLFAGCGLAVLHLLVTLFGSRWAILLPLSYFLVSPFLIPATSWWAAGINHLPALGAGAMALAAHVRHLRDERRSDLWATCAWLVVGLCFAELTLFALLPLTVITLGYFATGGLGDRIGQVWQRYRTATLTLSGLVAAYLGLYLTHAWQSLPSPTDQDWSAFVTNATLDVFPVAAVGGPGSWQLTWAAQMEVHPSGLTRLLGFVAVGGVFALAASTRERSVRAWLVPLSQLVVATVLVGRTRALFGPGIALDLRFFVPLSLGLALGLALAFLPVRDAVETVSVRAPHWLVDSPVPAVLALAGVAAFGLVSARSFPLLDLARDHDPEPYLSAALRSVDDADQPVPLVDATVPERVLGPPVNSYRQALVQLGDRVRYPDVVQDDFYVFDDDGRLVRPELDAARNAAAPAPQPCGYPVAGDTAIPLDGPVLGFGWRLRIAYAADRAAAATVTIGDVSTPVDLLAGEHVLELSGDAEYEFVTVTGPDRAAGVCVSQVSVGKPVVPR